MANLSYIEKRHLENLLRMESGYVLNFSNRTFRDFIIDSVGRDIDDTKYMSDDSNSKAKRLRRFWSLEPSHTVGKLIVDLIETVKNEEGDRDISVLIEQCIQIAERLLKTSICATTENLAGADICRGENTPKAESSQSLASPEELSAQERLALIQMLNSLPVSQFNEIVFALNPPSSEMPSSFAPQGSRSSALLSWIESATGPGIFELTAILENLLSTYQRSFSHGSGDNKVLQTLSSNLKTVSAPQYDFRGATFYGGFAETVEGNQNASNGGS